MPIFGKSVFEKLDEAVVLTERTFGAIPAAKAQALRMRADALELEDKVNETTNKIREILTHVAQATA